MDNIPLRVRIVKDTAPAVQGNNGSSKGKRYCERIEIVADLNHAKMIAIYREGHGSKPWFLTSNYIKIEVLVEEPQKFRQEVIWVNKNSLLKRCAEEGNAVAQIFNELILKQPPRPRLDQREFVGLADRVQLVVSAHRELLLRNKKEQNPQTHFYPNVFDFTRPAIQEGENLYVLLTKRKNGDKLIGIGGYKRIKEVIHYKIDDAGNLILQKSELVVAVTRIEHHKNKQLTFAEAEKTRRVCNNEAYLLEKLKNIPNILHVHAAVMRDSGELGKYGKKQYLILDRAKIDLIHAIQQHTLPKDKIKLAIKIAEALASMHEKGILHLDLKLENVLLNENGEPLINDFGLSCDRANRNRRKELKGTFYAPEQLNALTNAKAFGESADLLIQDANDFPADHFALGLILISLFIPGAETQSLRALYHQNSRARLSQEELDKKISTYNIPPKVLVAIKGLLTVDPEKRITAQAAADILRASNL